MIFESVASKIVENLFSLKYEELDYGRKTR